MAVKQAGGRNAPDGSMYVTNTDGAGNLGISAVRPSTVTYGGVTAATSATALLTANVNRLGATIFNSSTAILYVLLGGAAVGTVDTNTTYSVQVPAGGYYEVPYGFTGAMTGIWSAVNGSAKISELT